MGCVSFINGVDFKDFELSYTLTVLLERLFKDYYKLNKEEKLELFNQFDKEISDKLKMPRANILWEKKEFTLDTDNLYFGKLSDIKSGYEFISRYFFEKRQQYQRLCVVNQDRKSLTDREFEGIKNTYDLLPLTKKNSYIPYNKGLAKYLSNYSKMDAIMFMFDASVACLGMVDQERILMSMSKSERDKFIVSLDRCEEFSRNLYEILNSFEKNDNLQYYLLNYYDNFKLLKLKERYFISQLASSIVLDDSRSNKNAFLCFHENVWEHLNEDEKKVCIEVVNELIADVLECSYVKNICYSNGLNSYNFVNGKNFYLGDITNYSAREILCKLVYEYSFVKVYEESIRFDYEYMMNEYEECKKKYQERNNYYDVLDSDFIQDVRVVGLNLQSGIYNYINKNLKMDGKRIEMPMKKKDFIMDIFNPARKRR